MKSLKSFIDESMKCNNKKLDLKRFKELRALMKNYDHTKFKLDPKIAKHFEKTIKESEEIDTDEVLQNYETWVQDTIGEWMSEIDVDDPDDVDQLRLDLMNAEKYFKKYIDDFYDEFGYDERDNIAYDYEYDFKKIIQKVVDSAKQYVERF